MNQMWFNITMNKRLHYEWQQEKKIKFQNTFSV